MNFAYDLFLLTFNLSQLDDKEKIIELFVDGMKEIFKPSRFKFYKDNAIQEGSLFEIKTGKSDFGIIAAEISESSDETNKVLISNAVSMLAIVLEHLYFGQNLEKERDAFENLANLKIDELNSSVKDLEEARTASINLIEDLTEENKKRKKAELELIIAKVKAEKSEKYLDSILNNMGDPLFVKDDQSRILLANDAFCALLELSRELIIGKTLAEDVTPDERESFLRIDKQVLADGKENVSEESMTVRGGQTRTISTRKTRFIDNNGKKILIGAIRDITERKHAELELIKAKEEAEKSEKKVSKAAQEWQTTFDAVNDAIWLLDKNQRIVRTNKEADRVFSPAEKVIGKHCWEIIHGKNEPIENCPVLKAKKTLTRASMELNVGEKWFQVTADPVLDERGKFTATIHIVRDITEKRLVEEALKESEAKFRNLFENSPLGKSMTGIDGSLVVNKSFCRILGYSESELKTKTWKEISHADDIPATDKIVKSIIEGETNYARFEKRYIHKNGKTIWTDVSTYIQRDSHDNPMFFITTVNDITERKNNMEQLILSESKFRSIVESSPMAMYLYRLNSDNQLIFMGANDAADSAIGIFHKELMGMPIEKAFPNLAGTDVPEIYRNVASGKIGKQFFEITYDEERFKGIYEVSVFQTSPKNIAVDFFDITERRKAEEVLRTNYSLLRVAGKIAKFGGWDVDLKNYISNWSDEVAAIHEMPSGYSPLVSDGIDFYAPEWRDKITKVFTDCAEKGIPYDELTQIITSTGKYVWVRTIGEAVKDEEGKIVKVHGFFQDITEQKNTEVAINKLNEELETRVIERTAQLETANKELEAFSYSVSHDLRAPLRAVHSFTKILSEDYGEALDAEGKRICGIIESSSVHMGQLIDDLLAFSRIGRAEFLRSKIDITSLTKSIYSDMTTPVDRTRIDFNVSKLPSAYGDTSAIKQVLTNLLSNAIKYSSNCEKSEILVGFECTNGETVYFIKDNGVGFEMKYASKLFGMFQRLHSVKEFEGNGVGLAIVQRIIHRHGGKVWAEAEVGQGATFYFTVPVNK